MITETRYIPDNINYFILEYLDSTYLGLEPARPLREMFSYKWVAFLREEDIWEEDIWFEDLCNQIRETIDASRC